MTNRIIRICGIITNCRTTNYINYNVPSLGLLKSNIPLVQNNRNVVNFFNKRPASLLWKAVTSVSNAGKRRGRGKGITRMKDLNKGQKIGSGKIGMAYPGLNSSLVKGTQMAVQEKLPVIMDEEPKSIISQSVKHRRFKKLHPFEYGWTSASVAGRKIGPPDPVDGETFENFDSWILICRSANTMSSIFGRVKMFYVTVLTGNKNGLAGFATVRGKILKQCIIRARNRAGQKLVHYQRYNDHTVLNDFYSQFGKTKIFVRKVPEGYGIVTHRIIRVICESIGIKDLYAKVEGCTNPQHILKAFFIGLLKQKSYQQMANEKQLHLVELRKETGYFPKILASPETLRTKSEIKKSEIIDFQQYIMDGRIVLRKKPQAPPFSNLPSYVRYIRKTERRRGQDTVRLRLKAEYGELCSFLAEKYPEAKAQKFVKKLKAVEEE